MTGDGSKANRPMQTINTSEHKLRSLTTNQRQDVSRDTEGKWTTIRRNETPTKLGKFGLFDQTLGKSVPGREVQDRQISDPDRDVADEQRASRLPRHMFKPGLIVRAPLHVSLRFSSSHSQKRVV